GEIVYGSFKSGKPQCHLNNLRNILLPAVNILSIFSMFLSFSYILVLNSHYVILTN
ncbi:unnamed protein product, partial [marine sediment metagenome]